MILTPSIFATICQFVLREGDRQTYCNKYNDNPHIRIGEFDVYLNPQLKSFSDPSKAFDEIVFQQDSKYTSIKFADDALQFDANDKPMLERYFALAIAHISSYS